MVRPTSGTVLNAEQGDEFPERIGEHVALAVLGGSMSANDARPSLRRAEALILDAMARDRPVLGHCLGGQLMAKALGARVLRSPQPEIGWHRIDILTGEPAAQRWFGDASSHEVFQWHEDAFELPPHSRGLATGTACPWQAFSVGALHLAMQFHVELDAMKLERWMALDPQAVERARSPTLQSAEDIRKGLAGRLSRQHALAEVVYAQWSAAFDFS